MSTLSYILVFGLLGGFAVVVIWAMWWAIRGGQMSNFQKGATSIFDADEPIGMATDKFPGERPGAGADVKKESKR